MEQATLVPNAGEAVLESVKVDGHGLLLMMLRASGEQNLCPQCHRSSTRVHSHYQRKLRDLPWEGIPVRIQLHVRRFFCDTEGCGQRIFTERLPNTVHRYARRTCRLLGIKEVDNRHLLTAHCHPENSAVDQYKDSGWLDLNTTYTYEIVHHKLQADYNRKPAMPYVLIETTYEGEHNASAVQIRRQAYWALLYGAAGQFMGNRPIWLFDPGWQAALDGTASRDLARVQALFRSRPWYDLVPDQDNQIVVDGLGEFNGLDYVAAARTQDGGTVMAYMPSARTVTVDLHKVAGKSAKVWWFNPRAGDAQPAGEFPTIGKQDFTPPWDGDWLLVLDDASRNLSAP